MNERGGAMLTKRKGAVAMMIAALACAPASVIAAECRQANAIYADRDGAYELRFSPITSEAATSSHRFKLSALKTPVVMDGYVMPSDDPERTMGMVLFNCPDGDVTGADLDACTVWQGFVYRAGADGRLDNLQSGNSPAAEKIVFPGLGPAIRQSSVWGDGKAKVAPWDVLDFKGCAQ
ncbi:hypothetical protein [Rhizobium sp. BK529]